MTAGNEEFNLTDLADGTLAGPEWDEWLAAHPDLAAQVTIARQVRALIMELRAVPVEVPADFEAILLERVQRDDTLLGLLDLWLGGFAHVLIELLDVLFGGQPAPEPAR